MKAWKMYPKLADRVFRDHIAANMLGGPYPPELTLMIAAKTWEIGHDFLSPRSMDLALATCLVIQADRILEARFGRRDPRASKEGVRELVLEQLEVEYDAFGPNEIDLIVNVVLRHDDKNRCDDNPVLRGVEDAVRLVSGANVLFLLRSGQFHADLPTVDFVHLWSDPNATYDQPGSVLRDIVETLWCITPGTPFYVRLPRAVEEAVRLKQFFDDEILGRIVGDLERAGLYPYPPELRALREKYAVKTI